MANGKKAKSPRMIRTAEQCERAFQMLRKSIYPPVRQMARPVYPLDLGAMNSTHDPSRRIAMAVDGLNCGFNYSDPLSRKGKLHGPHFDCRHFARELSCAVC